MTEINKTDSTTSSDNVKDNDISLDSGDRVPTSDGFKHLVIMQHGLHGSVNDFNSIKEALLNQFNNNSNLIIVNSKCNDFFLGTHHGIDKCGERLADEVMEYYNREAKESVGLRISFLGHSLGGLIIRHAIGVLYGQGFFNKCEADQFLTLSSPHCGSRRPNLGAFNKIANIFVDTCISITGKQLALTDHLSTGREQPLLVEMTQGDFINGLKLFKTRTLYSNIYNDIQVNFCTSDISPKNPYTSKTKEMKFLPSYPHIIDDKPEIAQEEEPISDQEYQNYFTHEEHKDHLITIYKNLRQLTFTRYHMYFTNPLSHTHIVVKRKFVNREGTDIVSHVATNFKL
ncbi:hypothetical protein CYY_004344 [Polysphondylium violaceum]|uniref:DUF676 domain-containing protein n=1 Tax=Polysphondylium violaceum TaxID=133409 RepID=A0A8J4V7V7_9MYCE|nr:hypothetical protein CYY_004344 [Polysphondylium violaceum]